MSSRVLTGGEVILSGSTTALVLRLARNAVTTHRGNGIPPSREVLDLIADTEEGVFRDRYVGSLPEFRSRAGVSASDQDDEQPVGLVEIDVKEAAEMLGVTERAVRARCQRGTLDGRLVGGRWVVSLGEVAALTVSGVPAGADELRAG